METILTLVQFIQEAHHFDKDITLAINSLHSPISDSVWMVFSNKEIWYILYLAVLVMFFYRLGWKKALVALLACVLCIVVCDQTCNLFKDSVQRLRPCLDGEMISRGLHILERAGARNLYGFFSAHAANAMGFAACSLMCFGTGIWHRMPLMFGSLFSLSISASTSSCVVSAGSAYFSE